MPPVIVIRGTETVSYQVPTDWRLGFDGAAADFVDGLLAGRQPPQDVHEATRMLQVPLAIYESAAPGAAWRRVGPVRRGRQLRAVKSAITGLRPGGTLLLAPAGARRAGHRRI